MPAVNLPSQEAHGNVTLYQGPGAQLRLLYRTTPIIYGLLSLGVVLVLRIVIKRKYKPPSHPSTSWTSEEKSSQVNFPNETMSTNQPSGFSSFSSTEGRDDGGKRHSRDWSKEREDGEALKEEINTSANIDAGTQLILKSGPPPPLPLTPPTLLTGSFTFQDRRLSTAMSSMADFDTSFFSQPNPDYTFQSLTPTLSDSTSTALPYGHDDDYPSIPRRRSYTKMLPLGPGHADSEHDGASFAPSSFPSSSTILPLAPHESFDGREIDVKGEIVSVTNDTGAGWMRHSRVYGGGDCLLCKASGIQGGCPGGFYGDNVPPEHRHH
ncbi:hypothetical protein F4820DRAFT_17872 [Hypoxylon rubiginosum]|uniref:Uncharacterized protein n=1 Tax=Hypoxylon rubiginosum TaxID=110542 RepID=A0ACB9YV86_9PEZI|nr:hypothetical protein F4820DRAFT_17872 [Hypoxylon rubiginosum]